MLMNIDSGSAYRNNINNIILSGPVAKDKMHSHAAMFAHAVATRSDKRKLLSLAAVSQEHVTANITIIAAVAGVIAPVIFGMSWFSVKWRVIARR